MITFKTIPIPEPKLTREVLDFKECDLCGKVVKRLKHNWGKEAFEIAETELRFRWGVSYPEYGRGEEIDIDICPDCFKKKLLKWLKKEFNFVPVSKEWEW